MSTESLFDNEYFDAINNFKYGKGYLADAEGTEPKDYLDPTPFVNALGQSYVGLVNAARTDPIKMNVEHMDYTYKGTVADAILKVIHINLLMPQYARRVEVEDLDKNFWVISLCLDACLNAIWSKGGIIDILNNLKISDIFGETKGINITYHGQNRLNIYSPFAANELILTIHSQNGDRNINLPFINDIPDEWQPIWGAVDFNQSQYAHMFNKMVAMNGHTQIPLSLLFLADYKEATYSAGQLLDSIRSIYAEKSPINSNVDIMKQLVTTFNATGEGVADLTYKNDDGTESTVKSNYMKILNYKFDIKAQILLYDPEIYKIEQNPVKGTDYYRYNIIYKDEATKEKAEYEDVSVVLQKINGAIAELKSFYLCPLSKLHNGELLLLSSDVITNLNKNAFIKKSFASLRLHHAYSHNASYNRYLQPILYETRYSVNERDINSTQSLYVQYVKPRLNLDIIPIKGKDHSMVYFQKEIQFLTTLYTMNNEEYDNVDKNFVEYDTCNYNNETKLVSTDKNVFSEAFAGTNSVFHGIGSYIHNNAKLHIPSDVLIHGGLCVSNTSGKYNFTNGISITKKTLNKDDAGSLQDAVTGLLGTAGNKNNTLRHDLDQFCGLLSANYRNVIAFTITADDTSRYVRFPKIDYIWFKNEVGQNRKPEQLLVIPISYRAIKNESGAITSQVYQLDYENAHYQPELTYNQYDCIYKMPQASFGNGDNIVGYAFCFASKQNQIGLYNFKCYGSVGEPTKFIEELW